LGSSITRISSWRYKGIANVSYLQFLPTKTLQQLDDMAFTREELQALVEEARMHHKSVACHSECIEGTRMAVETGVNTIEHGDCPEGNEMALDD